MSTQLEQVRSDASTELLKRLSGGGILRERPADKDAIITVIAAAIDKMAGMYQVPNWKTALAVDLAEWTYLNYQFEELETIVSAITKAPTGDDRVYRMTPDVIAEWMTIALEKRAEDRETQHNKEKKKPITLGDVLTEEQMNTLADTVKDSKIKAVPKLTPEEQKFWGGERPKAVSTNYKNQYTDEEIEMKQAITKAGREFYRDSKYTYTSLKLFGVNEYQVLAATKDHAVEIFSNARQTLQGEEQDENFH